VIRDIAGRQNHSVRLARKLQHKKYRRERGLLVCEGLDLLVAAVESGADVREVLVRRGLVDVLPEGLVTAAEESTGGGGFPTIGLCDRETLEYASSLGGSADVVFVCAQPRYSMSDLVFEGGLTLFLDGVGDPGNVGAIIRGALAFGLVGVLCSPGTADPFGPKAMRAGMGAQFALPVVVEVSATDLAGRLAGLGRGGAAVPVVWVAEPRGGEDVREAFQRRDVIVVLGAERSGPSGEWGGSPRVSVPQERFESLNVAMAGTILAYEWWRKHRSPTLANEKSVRYD
jgi:TrmH family RNA methyltransferase